MRSRVLTVVVSASIVAIALSCKSQQRQAGQSASASERYLVDSTRAADSVRKYTEIRRQWDERVRQQSGDTANPDERARLQQTRDSLAVADRTLDRFRDRATALTAGRTSYFRARAEPSPAQTLWVVLCLVLYFLGIVLSRWHHIAKALHEVVEQQLIALDTRLRTEVPGDDPGDPPERRYAEQEKIDELRRTVAELRETVKRMKEEKRSRRRFLDFAWWSRGQENALWLAIHEVERQHAAFLAPPEQVEAYLRWAEAELRRIDAPASIPMANAIVSALHSALPADATEREAQVGHRKALLGRALSIIHGDRDRGFSTLMEWQNKASWLILAALIVIAFLAAASGRAVLFLAGAAGGFLSRLMRALRRENVPLDYGASWTTLFLSPLFGALAGWFGVALITLAANPDLNLLGNAFRHIKWDDPTSPATLAIAFLLGFSERLFDAVVGAVEKHAQTGEESQLAAVKAGAGAAASTAQPTGQPSGNGKAPAPANAVPQIAGAERALRAAGAEKDALLLKGSGFATGATATVNDEARVVEVQSAQMLVLPLSEEDTKRIDAGGDFEIVVANPGGAASRPYDFA